MCISAESLYVSHIDFNTGKQMIYKLGHQTSTALDLPDFSDHVVYKTPDKNRPLRCCHV